MLKKLSVKTEYSENEIPKVLAELTEFFSDVPFEVIVDDQYVLNICWRVMAPHTYIWFRVSQNIEKCTGYISLQMNNIMKTKFETFIRSGGILHCWSHNQPCLQIPIGKIRKTICW